MAAIVNTTGRFSKTQVDNAGKLLRDWIWSDATASDEEIDSAIITVLAYRSMFDEPTEVVTNKLRGAVLAIAHDTDPNVTSRPKTFDSILSKLRKLSTRLSQIEDMGGCRAVVPGLVDLYELLSEVLKIWPDARVDDKIKRPNDTGYRAIHVIAIEGDCDVEIQLRTHRQGRWADAVEDWGNRLGIDMSNWNL